MQSQYTITSTHWTWTKFSVTDGSGREIYTVVAKMSGIRFYPPGSEEARFEIRSHGFLGWERKLVEPAVEYVFGYITPKAMGKEGYEVQDVARNPIGFFKMGLTVDATPAKIEEVKQKGLKASMAKMVEDNLTKELIVNDKVIVRYRLEKNRKSVVATVYDRTAKNIDERLVLILGICSMRFQNNGGG